MAEELEVNWKACLIHLMLQDVHPAETKIIHTHTPVLMVNEKHACNSTFADIKLSNQTVSTLLWEFNSMRQNDLQPFVTDTIHPPVSTKVRCDT